MSKKLAIIAVCLFAGSLFAQEKARVFVTDSKSWEISGGSGGSSGAFGGETHGGARPQTAEIIKTFGEKCKDVTVTMKQEKANYVVVLEHEGGKSWIRKDNKVAVFNQDGDSIVSHSTMSLGGSVDDACHAIMKDWPEKGMARAAAAANVAPAAAGLAAPAPQMRAPELAAKLAVSSTPAGADIEIDGAFAGSTPSSLDLSTGEHTVAVKKSGYKDWQRKIKITGGNINLAAELEKNQ
jgi:PEGA domain